MNKKQKIIILISVLVLLIGGITLFLVLNNKKYEVTFETNGGTKIEKQIIKKNDKVQKPTNPTKEGYIFDGWYLEGVLYLFDEPITKNIVLEAKYTEENNEKVTISFDTDGGSEIKSIKINKNSALIQPSDPIKEGYVFDKWLLDENEFDFNTKIDTDITLKATYKEADKDSYTVTFNSNGGSRVSTKTVKLGDKVSKPANPTRNGYKFDGWYLDGKSYNFNTKVTKNITLVAKWTKVENEVTNKTTQAPTTQAPTTQAPTTQTPTTQAPTTQAPTTQAPTTQAPTTQAPTTQKVASYSYKWSEEGDQGGKYYLYVIDENGNEVDGTVTLTAKETGKSGTFEIPASGKLFVKDKYTVSNAKGK